MCIMTFIHILVVYKTNSKTYKINYRENKQIIKTV
jgi:hypothetical protein